MVQLTKTTKIGTPQTIVLSQFSVCQFSTFQGGLNPENLGFDLCGGKDDPQCPSDNSIYIGYVKPSSPADGKLRLVNACNPGGSCVFENTICCKICLFVVKSWKKKITNNTPLFIHL